MLWHTKNIQHEDSDQVLHTVIIGSEWVRVSIIDPLDENALLLVPHDEMKTFNDAVGAFIA